MVVSPLPVSPPPQYPIKWASPSLRPISSSAQKEEEVREQERKKLASSFLATIDAEESIFKKIHQEIRPKQIISRKKSFSCLALDPYFSAPAGFRVTRQKKKSMGKRLACTDSRMKKLLPLSLLPTWHF